MVVGLPTFSGDLLYRLGLSSPFTDHGTGTPRWTVTELVAGRPHWSCCPTSPTRSPDDGPEAFPGIPTALVSGRDLTWYGPSMATSRASCRPGSPVHSALAETVSRPRRTGTGSDVATVATAHLEQGAGDLAEAAVAHRVHEHREHVAPVQGGLPQGDEGRPARGRVRLGSRAAGAAALLLLLGGPGQLEGSAGRSPVGCGNVFTPTIGSEPSCFACS